MIEEAIQADFEKPRWYALFVRSNQEKKTAWRLDTGGVEHFFPSYQCVRQWKDRRVKLEVALFPGYLFVRLPFAERMRVLKLPGVMCLAGRRNAPSPISDAEISWIRDGIKHGQAQPHACLSDGQRVKITAGAMSGLEGILLRHRNSTRVVVSLDSIAQAFVVEVDTACIEPMGAWSFQNMPAYPAQSLVVRKEAFI